MKKILSFLLTVLLVFSATLPMSASAETVSIATRTTTGKTAILEADLSLKKSVDTVNALLASEDIDEVIVLAPSFSEDDVIPTMPSRIMPMPDINVIVYRATNVVNGTNWTGNSTIAIATGTPGITLKIDQIKSVSCTFSSTVGISANDVSSAVGFSVTKGENISIGGSYKVPTKFNNKAVKSASLIAKTVYSRKNFTVQSRKTVAFVPISNWANVGSGSGSGSASKPCGVSFTKTYVYK